MKNFEAYEDKIKELKGCIALNKSNELVSCKGFYCSDCKFSDKNSGKYCLHAMFEWLYEEYKKPKPKIPLAEKVILENLDDKWNWIARDKCGALWIFENKPPKFNDIWGLGISSSMVENFKKELFDFISWEDEEPTNIKELLENCVVVEKMNR